MNDLILTKEMFEASKVLASALCRGRASLFFDGYGVRKWLSIRGSCHAAKKKCVKIVIEIQFKKTVHEFELSEYMELDWEDARELLSILDDEPTWITLEGNRKKVNP